MVSSFERLCDFLSTRGGGYTLWLGAGATKAFTHNATPSWQDLVTGLVDAFGLVAPEAWPALSYSRKLEWISQSIGHHAFRKELRRRVVGPVYSDNVDHQTLCDFAIIGARASSITSFNIETVSGAAFAAGHGGHVVARTYREQTEQIGGGLRAGPGRVSPAVYYPHGLLDTQGNCVITESEYLTHGMSLAVQVAVSLCLGGDLLILGMSLSDEYLRDAVLKNRRWIRDVYWLDEHFDHAEWARTASVHCIDVSHRELWRRLADAHIRADKTGGMKQRREELNVVLAEQMGEFRRKVSALDQWATVAAQTMANTPEYDSLSFAKMARTIIDLGLEIPEALTQDPRYGGPDFWPAEESVRDVPLLRGRA